MSPKDKTIESTLSGQLTNYAGDPLTDVEIELYPYDRSAEPLVVQTDSNGEYKFSMLANDQTRQTYVIEPNKSVLSATDGDWFSRHSANLENSLGTTQNLSLNKQVLFGPTVASNEAETFKPSLITCYREVHASGRQDLFLEVVNLYSASDPPSNAAKYDILDTSVVNQLRSGTFLLSHLRNKAKINFGPQTEVGDASTPPVQVLAMPTIAENSELEFWHPLRTGLPLSDIGTGYYRVSTTDQTLKDGSEIVSEGVGMIADGIMGKIPVLSSMLSIADAIDYAVGDTFDVEASVGEQNASFPDPNKQENLSELPDPNIHVTTPLGWELSRRDEFSDVNAGAILMKVPMSFFSDVNKVNVTAQAEWLHDYEHVTFSQVLELDRVIKSSSNSDPNSGSSEVELRNVTITPKKVDGTNPTHTLKFEIVNLSPDGPGGSDKFSIKIPDGINVEDVTIVKSDDLDPEDPTAENPITFTVDPESSFQDPVSMEIELTLSPRNT